MFGKATITLGIGAHSSLTIRRFCFCRFKLAEFTTLHCPVTGCKVLQSACSSFSLSACMSSNFIKFYVRVTCGRDNNALGTSGFAHDVTFSHNGANKDGHW